MGSLPLRVRFPRLFSLAEDRWVTVVERASRGWMVVGGAGKWRRRLLSWEEESVSECPAILHNIVLQDNILDKWRWLLDPIHGYSVKGTYHLLTSVEAPTDRGLYVDVWHKRAPLKFLFSRGSCFVIEFRLKITWCGDMC